MATEPGVKGRAARRGLRSLDGKFYRTRKDRNDADRAFNKAAKKREAAREVLGDINKNRIDKGEKPFDFIFNQKEDEKPESTIVKPRYHCNYCRTSVEYGTPVCPHCNQRLNWEGL